MSKISYEEEVPDTNYSLKHFISVLDVSRISQTVPSENDNFD